MRSFREGDTPIPGYRLTTFLGRGGFGEVWKATAPGGFDVALKIISLSGKPGQKELRALEVVKALRHPNLVPVTAFWLLDEKGHVLPDPAIESEPASPPPEKIQETMMVPMDTLSDQQQEPAGRPVELVIAMGLADKSLFDRLQECQREGLPGIPDDELIRYMDDAARAIDYLNSPTHALTGAEPLAVQHCDIKPHNILITSGAAQVCDFGLARVMGDVKHTSATAGTIAYAAPECVIDGEPSNTTDQYSLAVSYLELKTGSLPYETETWLEVISAVQKGQLHLANLPPAERTVMKRATARNPAERFSSAVEMVKALKQAMERPETVTEASLQAPSSEGKSGLPLAAIAAGLVLLLLAGGGIWWMTRTKQVAGNGGVEPGKQNGGEVKPPKDKGNGKERILPPPKTDFRKLATDFADKGDHAGAVSMYSKALEENPEDLPSLFGRGKSRLALGKVAEAVDDFDRVKELDPEDTRGYRQQPEFARAYLRRGQQFIEMKDYAKAVVDFDYVIDQLKQPSPEAYFGRGQCELANSLYDEALDSFQAAADAEQTDPARYLNSPQRANAYAGRAELAYDTDKLEQAVSDSEAALKIDPKLALANLVRGSCWMREAAWSKALPYLNKAIEAYGRTNSTPWSRRGFTQARLGDYEKSAGDYSEAVFIDQKNKAENPSDYRNLGFALLQMNTAERNTLDRALESLNRGIKLDPKDGEAYYYRGEVYREIGQIDEALADYKRAIAQKPDLAGPYLAQATILQAMDKYEEALAGLTSATRVAAIWLPSIYAKRAEVHKAAGQEELAKADEQLALLANAAENDPQDVKSRCQLALQLAASPHEVIRDGARAEQFARQACKLTSQKDPACLAALAAALAEQAKFDDAVTEQQKAIKLATNAEMTAELERQLEQYRLKKPRRLGDETAQ